MPYALSAAVHSYTVPLCPLVQRCSFTVPLASPATVLFGPGALKRSDQTYTVCLLLVSGSYLYTVPGASRAPVRPFYYAPMSWAHLLLPLEYCSIHSRPLLGADWVYISVGYYP